jgi:uncharacterized membrane protein YhhN
MTVEETLAILSAVASAAYGLWFVARPVSAPRTMAKTAAVGFLAVLAYVSGAPSGLTIALVLSTAGDAFLAGDPRRWLPVGIVAFLIAHLSYVGLFVHDGGGRAALVAEPVRDLGVAAAFAATVTLMAWLWRSLGGMRWAVLAYSAAIFGMTAASFTLPYRAWPAMVGAVLFTASDAILSAELFKGARAFWTPYAIWFLYYAAQALIVWAYLR